VLPAGVSYIIRYFEPYPFYTAKAAGSKLFDVDGNEYIDFWIGHFSLILGHSPPHVMKRVNEQIENGTHYGTSHELEIALAEQVVKMVPSAEMVRFTNSGTEAIMYSVRLARTYTGREKIAKFEGGWHGGYDAVHTAVKPPLDVPESGGIPQGVSKDTVVLPFNNIEEAERGIRNEELAAVIVEPVLGAGGCIPAQREFLKGLREVCSEKGTLLIFDEVITGFRLSPGGAQQFYGVLPDITVLGKILGGGFPVGALAGRRETMEFMNALVYERPKYSFHGGTFCANPITATAGLATLTMLEDGQLNNELNKRGDHVREQLSSIFEKRSIDVQVTGVSSLFHTHFTKKKVTDIHGVYGANREELLAYHMYLMTHGIFFLPGRTGGLSTAHTDEDVNRLLTQAEDHARGT